MSKRMASSFLIKLVLGAAVLSVAGFYFFHQCRAYIVGPQIIVETPISGETLSRSYVTVKGEATNVASLSVNGRAVFADSSGGFEAGLLLAKGFNIIEISARDKFGRTAEKRLEVILK